MIKETLYLLLIGHFLGDFYFQTNSLAKEKDQKVNKLILHSILYALAMFIVILPVFSFVLLKISLYISLLHFVVDLMKFFIKKKCKDSHVSSTYLIDQGVHILVILLFGILIFIKGIELDYLPRVNDIASVFNLDYGKLTAWVLALLVIFKPLSITIKKILSGYKVEEESDDKGLPNAGALIGMLERGIILLMLSTGQYAAIGFVLTAKSIARYKKIADDPQFSEYYLLGTLLSTLLVIVVYLLVI